MHANIQEAKQNDHKAYFELSHTHKPFIVLQVWKCHHGWPVSFGKALNFLQKCSVYHLLSVALNDTHCSVMSHQQNQMNKSLTCYSW